MGLLTRAMGRGERRGVTLSPDLWRSIGRAGTGSGVSVSHGSALQISAVFACVRVLSETLASLPLFLYESRPDGGKTKARDHALYRVLHDIANPEMTAFTLREVLMQHLATWGNGYAEIEENGRGEILALWPLRPDKTELERRDGRLYYATELPASVGGGGRLLPAERVFHVLGPGGDGFKGYSMIGLHREAMGLAKVTETFGARFFGNGARPGMVLTHPGHLGEDAQKTLKDSWQDAHGGLDQSHRVAILEEGMGIETIGVPPDEAQFLATRKFQVSEIARIYRVPPHMIGDLEHATFSNIEHQGIEFVIHSMMPWLVRWEQEIGRQLLTEAERDRLYAEFLVAGLLRGDTASRYAAYSIGRQNGWLSANDVRQLENMDPIGGGDEYLTPLNMAPMGSANSRGDLRGPVDAGTEARALELRADAIQRRHRLIAAWGRQYHDAAGRMVRREVNDITNAAGRFAKSGGPGEFTLWLDGFYLDHRRFMAKTIKPVAWSYGDLIGAEVAAELDTLGGAGETFRSSGAGRALEAEQEPFSQRYIEAWAHRYTTKAKTDITAIVRRAMATGAGWYDALRIELEGWRDTKPAAVAAQEAVRFNNALAVNLYKAAGVGGLTWRTFGETCPYCVKLAGKRIGMRDWFLEAGTEFLPDGAERPLRVGTNVRHAPAHAGCDCLVVAG